MRAFCLCTYGAIQRRYHAAQLCVCLRVSLCAPTQSSGLVRLIVIVLYLPLSYATYLIQT